MCSDPFTTATTGGGVGVAAASVEDGGVGGGTTTSAGVRNFRYQIATAATKASISRPRPPPRIASGALERLRGGSIGGIAAVAVCFGTGGIVSGPDLPGAGGRGADGVAVDGSSAKGASPG